MNLWAGRRSEKVLRRQWRKRVEEVQSDIALALGRPLGNETPRVRNRKKSTTVATITSTRSTSTYDKDLIDNGFYQLEMVRVSDPQTSTFTRRDGSPADDYVYCTFKAYDEDGDEVGEFDGTYPWSMWARYDAAGVRTKVANLQQLAEAFLGREIEDGEEIDFDQEIISRRRRAQGTVVVGRSKDGTKEFNRIESILPVKKKKAAPAANGTKSAAPPAEDDETPF